MKDMDDMEGAGCGVAELRSLGFSLWFGVPALQQNKNRNIAGQTPLFYVFSRTASKTKILDV